MRATRRASSGAAALVVALALAPAVHAADVTASLPVVTVGPGVTVDVPITLSGSLVPLNVTSIQLEFPINPTYISNATWAPSGLVTTWGTPFMNTTATLASLATFGTTPIGSPNLVLATLQVTVKPGAPVADVPLTLSLFRLNGATPTTAVANGTLQIRSGVGVNDLSGAGLRFAAPFPAPATRGVTFAYTLPDNASGVAARIAVFGVDGRRLRTITITGEGSTPGSHTLRWDLRDEAGARVRPGIYFARLEWRGQTLTRRLAVAD